MKKIAFSLIITMTLVGLVSCAPPEKNETEKVVVKKEVLAENKESVDMKVEGMVCAKGCAKYIEDKVAELDGVVLSSVDFAKGQAHFEFDKTIINPADLEKFIDEMHDGQYQAGIIDVNEPTEDVEVEVEKEKKKETKKEVASVVERFQISIPELFSYFLHSIR